MPCSSASTSQSPLPNSTTTEPPEESDRALAHIMDHKFYPMIMDAILDYAPHSVLVAFRRTSREYLERTDARIFKHIVVGAFVRRAVDGSYKLVDEDEESDDCLKLAITTPWGDTLPAIRRIDYNTWMEGTPDDEKELEKRYLELFGYTRIIDIDDTDDENLQWFTDKLVLPQRTAPGSRDRVKVVRLFPNFPCGPDTLGDTAIIFPTRWPREVKHDKPWPRRNEHAIPAYTSRAVHIIRVRPDYGPLLDYSNYNQDPKHSLREETFIFTHARPLDADMKRFLGRKGKEKNKARWDGFVSDVARRLVRHQGPNLDPITCTMVDFAVLQPGFFNLGIARADMQQRLLDDIANVLQIGVDMGEHAQFNHACHVEQSARQRKQLARRTRVDEIAEGYLGYPRARGPRDDDPLGKEKFMMAMEKSREEMEANPPSTPPPEPDEWLPITGVQTLSEDLIPTALEHIVFLSAEEYAKTSTETDLILEAVPDGYFDPPPPGDEMARVRSWRPWKPGRCG